MLTINLSNRNKSSFPSEWHPVFNKHPSLSFQHKMICPVLWYTEWLFFVSTLAQFDFLSFWNYSNASEGRWIVAKSEGQSLASSLGTTYAECSSLLGEGVQQAINTAVELAVANMKIKSSKKGYFRGKGKGSNSAKQNEPLPPTLPPAGR